MMEIAWQYIAVLAGLFSGYLCMIARDRRRAVDRLVGCIEAMAALPADTPKPITESLALKCRVSLAGGSLSKQDAPGRVIARSVERVTK